MKFQCSDCKKTFLYASITNAESIPGVFVETHACPYCYSLNFEEYVEPVGKIVSVLNVDILDTTLIEAKLKEGYEVRELYAKTCVMIKKEKGEV